MSCLHELQHQDNMTLYGMEHTRPVTMVSRSEMVSALHSILQHQLIWHSLTVLVGG